MSAKFQKKKKSAKKRVPVLTGVLAALVVFLTGALVLMLLQPTAQGEEYTMQSSTEPTVVAANFVGASQGTEMPAQTEEDTQSGTEEETIPETEPETTVPAPMDPVVNGNGNPSSVLCKSSYTADSVNPAAVVATAGDYQLTAQALQIFYAAEVNAYRSENHDVAPNFAWPLENQICPLGSGAASWQHYFLERAVRSWQNVQALVLATQEPQLATDPGYKFLDYLHAEYVPEDRPVHNFIYGDRDFYTPNKTHQAYLDSLSTVLDSVAAAQGCTADELVRSVFGSNVTTQDFLNAARNYNLAYMYFTERSFDLNPSDAEVAEYLNAHITEIGGSGDRVVSLRHLMLIPEGASVGADGKVSASEEQWAACQAQAQKLYDDWKKEYVSTRHPEGSFAQLTSTTSQDLGSKLDGGYYQNVEQGQLNAALDSWCFDSARNPGDMTILRSDLGVHIVYFSGSTTKAQLTARDGLLREQEKQKWQSYLSAVPLNVDYSAVSLAVDTTGKQLSLEDLLYPDVAHERFPEAITYLQQDFYYYRWGASSVGQGGCGITTFAMLSTYMTDTLQTPAMMADRYAEYFANGGTNADIFRFAVGDMGYYLDRITTNIDDATSSLKEGQRVISLQVKGHFTSAGHYLLLQRFNEDGTYQLRDSNVYNYLRLNGHKLDAFTRADILSGGTNFWVMQPKIVRIPACWRCGTTFDDHQPELLLNSDYTCEKCSVAMSRRDSFLSLIGTL